MISDVQFIVAGLSECFGGPGDSSKIFVTSLEPRKSSDIRRSDEHARSSPSSLSLANLDKLSSLRGQSPASQPD